MSAYAACVLSNSHLAALKLAWTNRVFGAREDFTFDFFGARTCMLKQVRRKGRSLVPRTGDAAERWRFTSGGKDRIDIDDYDALVVVACGFGIDVPKLRSQCGTLAHSRFSRVENLVSAACFEAASEEMFEATGALHLIDLVRKMSELPIFLVAAPFISEVVLEREPYGEDLHLSDRAALAAFVAQLRTVGERVASRRRCETIWQDQSTVAFPGFTRRAFNRDPARLDGRQPKVKEFDDRHGNEDYGEIAMRQILRRLDEISGGRVLAQ